MMREYNDLLLERLRNPEEAQAYLEVALDEFIEDHDKASFLQALHSIALAQGGFTKLSNTTSLNRQSLYRALSSKGNPKLDTVGSIIKGLGFRMSIKLDESVAKSV